MPEDGFYLTCGQRWLVDNMMINPPLSRSIQRVYLLNKVVDYFALVKSIRFTVASHPSLRLRLFRLSTGWRQYFPDQTAHISGTEVNGIMPERCHLQVQKILAEEVNSVLDLTKESPVRAKIIKVNGESLLSLCVDHIAADGMSFDLLEKTMYDYYQHLTSGAPLPLTDSDTFISYLEGESSQQSIEHDNSLYWQAHLKAAPIYINSNCKRELVPISSFHYQIVGTTFQRLLTFCRLHRCTILSVLVSVQLLLLFGSDGADDIVLGIPISNRALVGEESIVGNLFIPLYIRFILIPNEPVIEFVQRIRDQILDAMDHRQYDSTSLIRFLSSEGKKKDCNFKIVLGCNLMRDDNPIIYPNSLFLDRLDLQLSQFCNIYEKSFYLVARQTGSMLDIDIKWDAASWHVKTEDMEIKFLIALRKICGDTI